MSNLTQDRFKHAQTLLDAYLERTGITADGDPDKRNRRYLWTDAFAVLCCLGCHHALHHPCYREIALTVIEAVHDVLGHHREDDPRRGWISGLNEREGRMHPTARGLRIGKPLPEKPREPPPIHTIFPEGFLHGLFRETASSTPPPADPMEGERDGQYFHYLVRWAYALMRVSTVSDGKSHGNGYLRMASELMVASRAFVKQNRLVWKMNTDLTHPAVGGMGAHDPLDGLVCVDALQRLCPAKQTELSPPRDAFESLCRGKSWITSDSLGIGGLLLNLCRVMDAADAAGSSETLPESIQPVRLYKDAMQSLAVFRANFDENAPACCRLAFRECGLSLGLRVYLATIQKGGLPRPDSDRVRKLAELATHIEDFWIRPANQTSSSWTEHEDINAIMLSSSLIATTCPEVFC